jgi:hypothetical protein
MNIPAINLAAWPECGGRGAVTYAVPQYPYARDV